ncbi:hypothetical protein O181_059906 [Austropuccinia psidii MF-1]|uniref:G protein-coupled receptor GPR1/2/3 C-terminal domain-containing protein n=1 Tax=Austropuccinia psidii MF-1 TaxID=1389203 RepID=A0A9Q3EJW1_9BASI|nr:hypothetical protein [Austropuccinia psidii MF-1]
MLSQSIEGLQPGIISVAVAAQLSLVATLFLILILVYHRLCSSHPLFRSYIGSEAFCLKFLRSQFAILFFDLLVSDFLQAAGFTLNLAHVGKTEIYNSGVCVAQGVLIQVGDISGAFATLAIAIHTFLVLIIRKPPATSLLLSFIACKWLFVLLLTTIGPLAFAQESNGPFYGPAGAWCWITKPYAWERFCLHYIWLFITGSASAIIYGLIFCTIRQRIRTHVSKKTRDPTVEETSMESAAKKMLLYPLCYLLLMIPLGSYRLASTFGQTWSIQVQIGCGFVFTLAGLVDSIVFCWTRNLFFGGSRSQAKVNEGVSAMEAKEIVESRSEKTLPDSPSVSFKNTDPAQTASSPTKKQTSFASRLNGSNIQFMPAKYCLATIDMNSFDDTESPTSH